MMRLNRRTRESRSEWSLMCAEKCSSAVSARLHQCVRISSEHVVAVRAYFPGFFSNSGGEGEGVAIHFASGPYSCSVQRSLILGAQPRGVAREEGCEFARLCCCNVVHSMTETKSAGATITRDVQANLAHGHAHT